LRRQRAREGNSSISRRPSFRAKEVIVKLLYSRCAGLDVHKKNISACIRISQGRQARQETRTFGTFTADLESLREWLTEQKVSHVAMESTGVFWIPVWNVLEQGEVKFELTLINPQHVHALPGCKTDRKDGQRIAELMQYGLLRGSFIPPSGIRELRDLSRRRAHLQGERNRAINRIRRLLETANIKLGSVVSDITGKTASLILAEICRGNCTPEELAKLAQASLKNKRTELIGSLKGFYSDHFRWLLTEAVQDLGHLDRKLEPLDKQLAKRLLPYTDLIRRLCTVPGVDFTTAAVIVAEIGFDMSRFADAAHLVSWAGLCPGNNESAGKRFSGCMRKGNRYLRRVLTQSAWSITHKKDCFLTSLFWRVAARGGRTKAAMAVAHRILIIAWHIINTEGVVYREIGGSHHDCLHPQRSARRLMRRLEQLGFQVSVKPKETSPALKPLTRPKASAESEKRDAHATTSASDTLHKMAKPKPADPLICRRCARWGIACIHIRNAIKLSRPITHPSESVT
jgi:transposase